jgi:alkylated DNA repair protein alkB family protein 6
LINEYKAGEGIMPHEDGPAYATVVATVSLAGSIVLDLYEKVTGHSRQDSMSKEDMNGEDGKEERNVEEIEKDEQGRPIPTWRILQEPGSLLVTTGEAYEALLHGISPITRDAGLGPDTVANWELLGEKERFADGVNERETRISLTYRDVLKVSKISIGMLGKR